MLHTERKQLGVIASLVSLLLFLSWIDIFITKVDSDLAFVFS